MAVRDDLDPPAGLDDDEDAPFHLPMLGLYADLELGSGAVQLPDEFMQADPVLQWRILRDWQRGLALLQEKLLDRLPTQPAGP